MANLLDAHAFVDTVILHPLETVLKKEQLLQFKNRLVSLWAGDALSAHLVRISLLHLQHMEQRRRERGNLIEAEQ